MKSFYKLLLSVAIFIVTYSMTAQEEYEDKGSLNEKKKVKPTPESLEGMKTIKITSEKKEEPNYFRENFRLGFGFNLFSSTDVFGRSNLYASITPQFTYMLSPNFEAGIGTGYTYIGNFGQFNSHTAYAGPVFRIYPFQPLVLQFEAYGMYNSFKDTRRRVDLNSIEINAFVGAGYTVQLGERSFAITGIKVNLIKTNSTDNQILPWPFFTMHFGI
ncbi:MAG: hypothetical protein MUE53_03030 [Chitinophagales bacterium]|jgi:hypothetical protein|nr:hypothetical protein [Chitinophagales bacterium]